MAKAKKRNPQDITLRNLRALHKKLNFIIKLIKKTAPKRY